LIGDEDVAAFRILSLWWKHPFYFPRQKPGVEAHHRTSSTGETITILKDFERGAVRETVRVIDG